MLIILFKAIKSRIARKDFKKAQDTFNPEVHQKKRREKGKYFARIITTKSTTKTTERGCTQKSKQRQIMYLNVNQMPEDHKTFQK